MGKCKGERMKVNDYATRTYKFCELKQGDVFRVADSEFTYMKVVPCIHAEKHSENEIVNTVVLNNGLMTYYKQHDDVILLTAEVIITGEFH